MTDTIDTQNKAAFSSNTTGTNNTAMGPHALSDLSATVLGTDLTFRDDAAPHINSFIAFGFVIVCVLAGVAIFAAIWRVIMIWNR